LRNDDEVVDQRADYDDVVVAVVCTLCIDCNVHYSDHAHFHFMPAEPRLTVSRRIKCSLHHSCTSSTRTSHDKESYTGTSFTAQKWGLASNI